MTNVRENAYYYSPDQRMPSHYERYDILAANNQHVYKLNKQTWDDLNRKFYQKMWPRLTRRRNNIENVRRNRQLNRNRGNMLGNVKPRLQPRCRSFDDRPLQIRRMIGNRSQCLFTKMTRFLTEIATNV